MNKPTAIPLLKGPEAITLMPHQQEVINYLNDNQDIKGILINHYMGTGKTYLALGFAEFNNNDQVVILAPSYLRNNWRHHMDDFKIKNPKRYQFLSFANSTMKCVSK